MNYILKYILVLSFFIYFGCNSDTDISQSILLADNIEIYCEEVYYVHHIENTILLIHTRNLSNYEIRNIQNGIIIQRLNAAGDWELADNISYNQISERILPYETVIDTFSISSEGIYRIGYELYFSENPKEGELFFSPQIIVVQKRTILPFRNIVPLRYFSTMFSAISGSFYIMNSLEDLDYVKTNIVQEGEWFYSLLKNENFIDSTLIGYTSVCLHGSGAHLDTDSLVNIRDTIWVYYTFDRHSVYQDVAGHTSLVAIKKTNLPILIGGFK